MEINVLIYLFFFPPQENAPYNKGAFRIEITFPAEYPFKPPKICFKTKIYHPNIDEKGQVCLPIISAENWKPATKTDQGRMKINWIAHLTDHISCSYSSSHSTGQRSRARTPAPCRSSRGVSERPQKVHQERGRVHPEAQREATGISNTLLQLFPIFFYFLFVAHPQHQRRSKSKSQNQHTNTSFSLCILKFI